MALEKPLENSVNFFSYFVATLSDSDIDIDALCVCVCVCQMDSPPLKTDVTTITRGAQDVLEIVGVHERRDHSAQRDHVTV